MMTGTYARNTEAANQSRMERAQRLAAKRALIEARLERLQSRDDLTWDRVGSDD